MKLLEKLSDEVKYVSTILTAIVSIAGILIGVEGKTKQIIGITAVAILLGLVIYKISEPKREVYFNDKGQFKRAPLPKPAFISLASVGIVWYILVSLISAEPQIPFIDVVGTSLSTPSILASTPRSPEITNIVTTAYVTSPSNELLVAWNNSQLNTAISGEVTTLERSGTAILILAEATSNSEFWQIDSKRLALEDVARYVRGIFPDKQVAKDYFLSGTIQDVSYDKGMKKISISFLIKMEE